MFGKNYNLFGLAGLTFSAFALICWSLIAHDDFHLIPIHSLLAFVSFSMFLLSGGLAAIFSVTGKKNVTRSIHNITYVSLFTLLLVLFNVAAKKYELFYLDTTQQSIYTLAPQSKTVLAEVKSPLLIRAFAPGGLIEIKLQALLERISKESENISWTIVDPERNPTLVERLAITEPNTLHLEYANGSTSSVRKLTKVTDELSIINAILALTSSGPRKAYFLSGHNEPSTTSLEREGYRFLVEALEGENFKVEELVLGQQVKIPDDADLLIIAAPKLEFIDFELEAVKSYIQGKGRLLLLHEPRTSSATKNIASDLGISIGNDLIVDSFVQLFSAPGFGLEPVVSSYSDHPIVTGFKDRTFFSTVSSVSRKSADDNSIAIIARTSDVSWAETNLERLLGESAEAAKDKDDISGPVPIAAAWEKGEARAVIFGDADFASNIHFRKAGNRDLVLNSVNWLVGENSGITLRPRTLRASAEPITAEQVNKMFISTAIIIPEAILLLGLILWWRRKR